MTTGSTAIALHACALVFYAAAAAQVWLHAACFAVACFSLFAAPLLANAVHGGYLRN